MTKARAPHNQMSCADASQRRSSENIHLSAINLAIHRAVAALWAMSGGDDCMPIVLQREVP